MERAPQPSDNTGQVIDITMRLITQRQQERAQEQAQNPHTYFVYPTAYEEFVARRQENIHTRRIHNGGVVGLDAPMPQYPTDIDLPEPPYRPGA